ATRASGRRIFCSEGTQGPSGLRTLSYCQFKIIDRKYVAVETGSDRQSTGAIRFVCRSAKSANSALEQSHAYLQFLLDFADLPVRGCFHCLGTEPVGAACERR